MRPRILTFLFLFFCIFLCQKPSRLLAASSVELRIEGPTKTIATAQLSASTFKEALDQLSSQTNLVVVYTQNGTASYVYSVDGVANNRFGDGEGWAGYLVRKNLLVEKPNYLNESLQEGDTLVLYYGTQSYTQKITTVSFRTAENRTTITVTSQKQVGNRVEETPVGNVKMYLTHPNHQVTLLMTNAAGKAYVSLSELGIYSYSFAPNDEKSYPNVIRTTPSSYFYGIQDKSGMTRGEAIAFFVHQFQLQPGTKSVSFSDVPKSYPYYKEIQTAASSGFVAGFQDGSFRPDASISFLQFTYLFGSLQPNPSALLIPKSIQNLPDWAKPNVAKALAAAKMDGTGIQWDKNVTENDALLLYNNQTPNSYTILK